MTCVWKRTEAKLIRFDLERPVGGSGVNRVDVVIVEIQDSEGFVGLGFSYVLGGDGGMSARVADHLLRTFVTGQPVIPPRALWKQIEKSFNRSGLGPNMIGLAAIDTACWDLEAKRRGVPLAVAMGGQPRQVSVYASGNYSAGQSTTEVAETTAAHVSRGYRWVKPRVSGAQSDIELISAVRDSIGSGVGIMLDANEKCDLVSAKRLLRVAQEFDVLFVEEPLPARALQGLGALKRSSAVPIAIGEHVQDVSLLTNLMTRGLADIVQPDLAMIGGLTPTYDLALIAESLDVVVSPHFLPGLFVHVAAAVSSIRWLEDFPLLEPLFEGWPAMSQESTVYPSDKQGHGLVLSELSLSILNR
ncbi:MAG: mandelate racemase/muconate lactonizing enzyme family protein [Xanthobacteraceae bacterium]|nr:mandelate racemase/muconate lactonizing enzyme family protein [Xanthobacteraceae bacterium]